MGNGHKSAPEAVDELDLRARVSETASFSTWGDADFDGVAGLGIVKGCAPFRSVSLIVFLASGTGVCAAAGFGSSVSGKVVSKLTVGVLDKRCVRHEYQAINTKDN